MQEPGFKLLTSHSMEQPLNSSYFSSEIVSVGSLRHAGHAKERPRELKTESYIYLQVHMTMAMLTI